MLDFLRNRRNAMLFDTPSESTTQHSKATRAVAWIESPLRGTVEREEGGFVFSQRHEASPLELFFDLIFVANLATFTSYHSINDASALYAYIGFFAVIWSSWFQITLHDVRFARDSEYERACKMMQFVVFVGFALVGSGFDPSTDPEYMNQMLQILSITLLISRLIFIVQYMVVLVWIAREGHHHLCLPLCLNILVYVVTGAVFAVTATALANRPGPILYSIAYVVLLLEALAVVGIACAWRTLSFRKTHLTERMGLLTLIVIGEGAIGVTKTIGKLLGKGQDLQLSGLILCILLVLFFIWRLYFDNCPDEHEGLGTVRQQIWSIMHFPLHLAIVGAVEGSQQMALARYVLMQSDTLDKVLFKYCMELHIEGQDLVDILLKTLKPFKLDRKANSLRFMPTINTSLFAAGNTTGLCATSMPNFLEMYKANKYPQPLVNVYGDVLSALYAGVAVAKPTDETDVAEIAYNAWQVVYNYYWISLAINFLCLAVLYIIIHRKQRVDIRYVIAISSRVFVVVLPIVFSVVAMQNHAWMYAFIGSALVIPTVVLLHLLVVLADGISSGIQREREKKSIIIFQEKGGKLSIVEA